MKQVANKYEELAESVLSYARNREHVPGGVLYLGADEYYAVLKVLAGLSYDPGSPVSVMGIRVVRVLEPSYTRYA